jgi:hypothetical protein
MVELSNRVPVEMANDPKKTIIASQSQKLTRRGPAHCLEPEGVFVRLHGVIHCKPLALTLRLSFRETLYLVLGEKRPGAGIQKDPVLEVRVTDG